MKLTERAGAVENHLRERAVMAVGEAPLTQRAEARRGEQASPSLTMIARRLAFVGREDGCQRRHPACALIAHVPDQPEHATRLQNPPDLDKCRALANQWKDCAQMMASAQAAGSGSCSAVPPSRAMPGLRVCSCARIAATGATAMTCAPGLAGAA